MIMEGNDNCKLCFEIFEDINRPRVLHCGHTYCTICLATLISNGNLSCPRCKRTHRITDATNFSINFDLEENILDAKRTSAHAALKIQSSTKMTKMETIIAEQRESVDNLIVASEEIKSQMNEYREFLLNEKKKHEEVLQMIRDLAQWHERIVTTIIEECKKVNETQEEGSVYDKDLKHKLPRLDEATSTRDAVSAVADLDVCFSELGKWVEQCWKEFPNIKIVSTQQIITESTDALSKVIAEIKGKSSLVFHHNSELSIMEKVNIIGIHPVLTLDKMRLNPEKWKKEVASGRVYAISSSRNGNDRCARLSEENGHIYLHCLQDREVPQFVSTIKHTDIIGCLNKESLMAFLDLSWDGSFKGRILIHLYPDSSLTLHFRTLCTGDLGPSYAQTKFHEVIGRNESHELIRGGDYEHSTGLGGAQLFDLVRNENKNHKIREFGAVYVTPNTGSLDGAQFTISTGSGVNQPIHNIFGKVTEGLHVLKSAVRYGNIREVEITDSGVILPL